jgi:hypothetical protein
LATVVAAMLLAAWICLLLWRVVFGPRQWIMACCAEYLYFRLFRHFGGNRRLTREPILELETGELSSISLQTLTVFINGPDQNVVESLVVQLEPQTEKAFAEEFERLYPSVVRHSRDKRWFVEWSNRSLVIHWRRYRPPLREFFSKLTSQYPSLAVAPESLSELDLTGFARKSEQEKQRLLVEAKRLGFGFDCIEVVMNNPYRRMAWSEAVRYISEARVDSEPKLGKTEQ